MEVNLVNPDKVFWPEEGYTKKDLFDYYKKMLDFIYPYVKDRPQSLHRFPNGIYGERFYQKNVNSMPPEWVRTWKFFSESNNEYTNYIVPGNKEAILYMINLGCIELNGWNSRFKNYEKPDYLVIDLDPEDIEFDHVVEVAQTSHQYFEALGLKNFVKTSGVTGIHIFIPLGAKYFHEQVKNFAHLLVTEIHRLSPEFTSLERLPKKRQGCVYLDYLQNNLGQTMAAPFSVRPKPGATVSMPLFWNEVKKGLSPKNFTIKNAYERATRMGDPFLGSLGAGVDMEKVLNKIEKTG